MRDIPRMKNHDGRQSMPIPLIGKDGDDVIDNITCELTGTESINTQTNTHICAGKRVLNCKYTLKLKLN